MAAPLSLSLETLIPFICDSFHTTVSRIETTKSRMTGFPSHTACSDFVSIPILSILSPDFLSAHTTVARNLATIVMMAESLDS